MARTIFRVGGDTGFLAGTFQRGRFGDGLGSIRQIVADGDTVNVSSADNFPIRFLGIDTPESRFISPETGGFVSSDNAVFQRLLADPLSSEFGPMLGLTRGLADRLAAHASADAAEIHHGYAKEAEDELERLIAADFETLGIDAFFLAFAYDALDGFGRLLCYVHPSEPDTPAAERQASYNARMLDSGLAYPYFIFPNVDPFRSRGSPIEAAAMAVDPQTILARAPRLRAARASVAAARDGGRGVFSADRPNPFEPFELRFIARRRAPTRWLIDLSGNARTLYPPTAYPRLPNAEDRLWLPAEFVPLFEAGGWTREDAVVPLA